MSGREENVLERVARLEARLAALEARLADAAGVPAPGDRARPAAVRERSVQAPAPPGRAQDVPGAGGSSSSPKADSWQISVTGIMASGAGIAFLLAAVYFLRLVYDSGWLTPERQAGLALLGGIGLIAAGLALARRDRAYAAYLPAVGVVILYLTVYAADLYYGLIGPGLVAAGVGAVSITALWLQRQFGGSLYALFAVVGTYLFPILLPSRSPTAIDLIVYFAAWGLLFSWLALQSADRTIYLLALWFALLGFDTAWRASAAAEVWAVVATFQFAQFLLFATTAAVFSKRHDRPLLPLDAVTHGAALFVFYGLEYALLKEHAPALAPGAALASVVVIVLLLAWTRRSLGDRAVGGAGGVLVSLYASVVTTHVVLLELLPVEYFAWGILMLPVASTALAPLLRDEPQILVPIRIVGGVMFAAGLLLLTVSDPGRGEVAFPTGALLTYAAFLYVGAARGKRDKGRHPHPPLLLYAGHIALMVAVVKAFDSALTVSLSWAVLAVALLVFALRRGDRIVGQSSLLIFFASSLKVLLYDLDGSSTLIRVLILIVTGCSLYLGGWLYQRMPADEARVSREA